MTCASKGRSRFPTCSINWRSPLRCIFKILTGADLNKLKASSHCDYNSKEFLSFILMLQMGCMESSRNAIDNINNVVIKRASVPKKWCRHQMGSVSKNDVIKWVLYPKNPDVIVKWGMYPPPPPIKRCNRQMDAASNTDDDSNVLKQIAVDAVTVWTNLYVLFSRLSRWSWISGTRRSPR